MVAEVTDRYERRVKELEGRLKAIRVAADGHVPPRPWRERLDYVEARTSFGARKGEPLLDACKRFVVDQTKKARAAIGAHDDESLVGACERMRRDLSDAKALADGALDEQARLERETFELRNGLLLIGRRLGLEGLPRTADVIAAVETAAQKTDLIIAEKHEALAELARSTNALAKATKRHRFLDEPDCADCGAFGPNTAPDEPCPAVNEAVMEGERREDAMQRERDEARDEVARLREVVGFWERGNVAGLLGITPTQLETVREVLVLSEARYADAGSNAARAHEDATAAWIRGGRALASKAGGDE